MIIGVIFVGYDTADLIPASLQPWIDARRQQLGGHQFKIAAVCVPFTGFPHEKAPDNTQELLEARLAAGEIDTLITSETPIAETEARGRALRWLVDAGVEATLMVDSDEVYVAAEIQRVFAFVESRPLIAAFKGSLKNYVFDDKTYLTEPFTPMRLHRVRHGTYVAHSFWDDNNVLYRGTLTRDFKRDIDLAVAQIPKAVQWTPHYSWLSNSRSRDKCLYQASRPGWTCSFMWDEASDRLIWRPGQPIPEVARDE